MPSHKSCKKRMRTSNDERLRNRTVSTQMRRTIKELRAETDKEKAQVKYREVASLLDRAAQRHIIHKKNADRNKSRLALLVGKVG